MEGTALSGKNLPIIINKLSHRSTHVLKKLSVNYASINSCNDFGDTYFTLIMIKNYIEHQEHHDNEYVNLVVLKHPNLRPNIAAKFIARTYFRDPNSETYKCNDQ